MYKKREKYAATKGVENEGYEFEIAVLTFLSFQLCYNEEIEDFKLAIYDDFYRPFDDVVIRIKTDLERTYALQLKHVKDGLALNASHFAPKGKMALNKFFKFDFSRCDHVALVTNGIVSEELAVGSFNIKTKETPTSLGAILDTSGHIFDIVNNDTGDKITLYACQKNNNEIEATVLDKIKRKFAIGDKHLKNVLQKFKDFFQIWKKGGNELCRLDKEDIQLKIAEILFFEHIVPYKPCFNSVVEERRRILQNVLNRFTVTILRNASEEIVENLYRFDLQEDHVLESGRNEFLIVPNSDGRYKEISTILWRLKKFPLVLRLEQDTKNMIFKLVEELSKKNLSFIFIGDCILREEVKNVAVFEHLNDLEDNEEIVKNFQLSIQGRSPTPLQKLTELNPHFLEIISMKELILMLEDTFLVGEPEEILPRPYIPRHLLSKMLKMECIEHFPYDLFFINGNQNTFSVLKTKIKNRKYFDYEKINASNCQFPPKSVILTEKEIEENECFSKYKSRNVHYLKIVNEEHLQWIYSRAKSEQLWKYRVVINEDQVHRVIKSNVNLIYGRPGMGKLTLLNSLKNNCPECYWTERVVYYKNSKNEDFFANKVKQCLEEAKRIIYFFYGRAMKMKEDILHLSREGYKIWIFTANDVFRQELETTLKISSLEIQEFDEEEQQRFIRDRLEEKCRNEETEKILTNFKMLKNDILGAPMHLYMLTEIVISNQIENVEEIFILTDIYKYFLDTKYRNYLSHYGCNHSTQLVQDGTFYRNRQYELAAVNSNKYFKNPKLQHCDSYFLNQIRDGGDVLDVISKVTDKDIVIFSHQTHADYFTAIWLTRNFHRVQNLQNFIFGEELRNVFFMFNLELTKECPAHVAVLYRNHHQLRKHEEAVDQLDKVERTPLHIACSSGTKYPKVKVFEEDGTYKYLVEEAVKEDVNINKIIDFLVEKSTRDPLQRDRLFGWNLLDHAVHTFNLYALEKLLARVVVRDLDLDVFSVAYYAVKFGFEHLLSATRSTDVLRRSSCNGESLLHMAAKTGNSRVVEILVDAGLDLDAITGDYYKRTPLHLATEYGHEDVIELLLRRGASVHSIDRCRGTPLHVSASKGDRLSAKILVRHGADVDASDNFGRTPLHRAASEGHMSVVQFLVENRAKINHPDRLGKDPVTYAKMNRHVKVAKFLVSKGGHNTMKIPRRSCPDELDVYNKYPLHWAATIGELETIDRLLGEGCHIDELDDSDCTPLLLALGRRHKEAVRMLVGRGADVNRAGKYGLVPLYWAMEDVKMAELFLNNGADLDVKDDFGYTPLHWASMQGNSDLVKVLLEKNADVEVCDEFEMKPVNWAVELGHCDVVELLNNGLLDAAKKQAEFLQKYENLGFEMEDLFRVSSLHESVHVGNVSLARKFLDLGNDVNEVDKNGHSTLYRAVVRNHKETVEFLLENGADINLKNSFNSTPLHWACLTGNIDIVKILLKFNAKIDVFDDFYYTPLHLATMRGYPKTVSLLIDAGCDVNVVDALRNTPLDYGCKKGHVRTVKILLKNGAVGRKINHVDMARKQNVFFKPYLLQLSHF